MTQGVIIIGLQNSQTAVCVCSLGSQIRSTDISHTATDSSLLGESVKAGGDMTNVELEVT